MARINTYSPHSDGRVSVQYQRDRDVSVGVQRGTHPIPVTGDGAPMADATLSLPATFEDDGGLWVDLDRAGINNLIRSLREGRDKAFGKDE